MTETWDSAGYIASSRYRLTVCEYLSEHGSGLPSRIATETGLAQPHVSRALSELRDEGIVELLVPESQQKGRLYGLTDLGELAYERVALDQRVDLTVVDADGFPAPELVDKLEATYGDSLRAIAWCEPSQAWVHFSSPTLFDEYDEETLKTVVSTLANEEPLEQPIGELPTGGPEYIAVGLEKALVVRVPMNDDVKLLISVQKTFETAIEGLVDTCIQATSPVTTDADD
ncbi:ArsR family transcriptional regulator [Haloferax sp. MBLA0076]|uniref:ArsR family transcriptional regulator n=1 Tax=Haloferax litoreum TaxID=2666140 RepID=A0A6A8GJH0_9EURY|nr:MULTISPECIES: winged helix-turn-helix domain-containing protein [Haloferax]KAB1194368.1 winged helix-turn-helix transcriptional regulator [Haloferax sp. CBA1148]MRX22931.1 ArsR family transcriptional regulator [Haloferax litoreum]